MSFEKAVAYMTNGQRFVQILHKRIEKYNQQTGENRVHNFPTMLGADLDQYSLFNQ